MTEQLIRKLELRDRLSEEEKDVLRGIVASVRQFGVDEDIICEGDRPTASTLILEGFTCRAQTLSDGGRQITSIHVAGDFVDLHSLLIKPMDHSVTTLTPCRVGFVPHQTLRRLSETQPHLTRMLWLVTLIDAAIHRRWMTAVGRQSALSRTAHLLCEMYVRQKEVSLTEGDVFRLPLSQAKLSDALGLSQVHTNRIIGELRATGFVEWRGERVEMKDFPALKEIGDFDPAYLNLGKEPR